MRNNDQTVQAVVSSFAAHKYHVTCVYGLYYLQSSFHFNVLALTIIAARRLGADWLVSRLHEFMRDDRLDHFERFAIALQLRIDASEYVADLEQSLETIRQSLSETDRLRLVYYLAQSQSTLDGPNADTTTSLGLVARMASATLEGQAAAQELSVCGKDLSYAIDNYNITEEIAEQSKQHFDAARYSDALFLCELGLSTCPKYIDGKDSDILSLRLLKGEIFRVTQRLDDAHAENTALLQFAEAEGLLGDNVYRTALNNQAHVLQAMGKHDEALSLGRQLLEEELALTPPDLIAVAIAQNFLGMCMTRQGPHSDSLTYFRQSEESWKKANAADHYGYGQCLMNIAMAFMERGDLFAAISHARKAEDILGSALGRDHPLVRDAQGLVESLKRSEQQVMSRIGGNSNREDDAPVDLTYLDDMRARVGFGDPDYFRALVLAIERLVENDDDRALDLARELGAVLTSDGRRFGELLLQYAVTVARAVTLFGDLHAGKAWCDQVQTLLEATPTAPYVRYSALKVIGSFHYIYGDKKRGAELFAKAVELADLEAHLVGLATQTDYWRDTLWVHRTKAIQFFARIIGNIEQDPPDDLLATLLRATLRLNLDERLSFLIQSVSVHGQHGGETDPSLSELASINQCLRDAILITPLDSGAKSTIQERSRLFMRRNQLVRDLLSGSRAKALIRALDVDPIDDLMDVIGDNLAIIPVHFEYLDHGEDRLKRAEFAIKPTSAATISFG